MEDARQFYLFLVLFASVRHDSWLRLAACSLVMTNDLMRNLPWAYAIIHVPQHYGPEAAC
jgi:hypothetical protein